MSFELQLIIVFKIIVIYYVT